jgi:hypothetical protein
MVETIGEAHAQCWKIEVRCAWGKRDAMKSIRECTRSQSLDLETLIWTRGRDFPLDSLSTRMKCPTCGSRRVRLLFHSPSGGSSAVKLRA